MATSNDQPATTTAGVNDPPRPMTSRNLNKTWRDVVWDQYAQDLEADVPFPVRYLIHAAQWRRDIFITIPSKIDSRTLRLATLEFHKQRRGHADPLWDGEHISVRLRARPAILEQETNAMESEAQDDSPDRGYTTEETEEWALGHDCRRP
ncbi:hypothetical protein G7054_g332 [Neopestalotiopsis clavispora]|nr:hypothetical protein G7054_g332 [Neopestalotiopsis clavispora]